MKQLMQQCMVINWKHWTNICRKRKNNKGVLLLNDNARLYIAWVTKEKIMALNMKVLSYLFYSHCILLQFDYNLFRSLQLFIILFMVNKLKLILTISLQNLISVEFYAWRINSMPNRWDYIIKTENIILIKYIN